MQPPPPAVLQLAQRLRQLRQDRSRLTQANLAKALGAEEPLAAATVASWESRTAPKIPPPHRLHAYAQFFATSRSFAGDQSRLFRVEELAPDEKNAYEKLYTELLRLRSAASGESREEQPTFKRSWHFPDAGRVTFVCAKLPESQIGPFGDPTNPNYTELQTYADIDALMELFGHVRMENPTATVHFKTPPEIDRDDFTAHLILLGGVVWNEITGRLAEIAKLPIKQLDDPHLLDSGEIFVAEEDGKARQFWPQWADDDRKALTADVGLLARVPSPLNADRTLTICNGIHSRGVYGAARTLTDAGLREGNERYISTNFGETKSFAILMSVPVINNMTVTPDFNSPGVVLYEWAQDAA